MIGKFFHQSACVKCPPAKLVVEELKKRGVSIGEFNINTADGLAEATLYSVLSTPTLLLFENGVEISRFTSNFEQVLT